MDSASRRFRYALSFLFVASIWPVAVAAQPPVYVTQWGSLGSGAGQFDFPVRVATDAAGNVYVSDFLNHRIQKFTDTGTYLTQWGSEGSGPDQFAPFGVAVDATGNVYITDIANSRVKKFTNTGTFITQWGEYGSGDGQFISSSRKTWPRTSTGTSSSRTS